MLQHYKQKKYLLSLHLFTLAGTVGIACSNVWIGTGWKCHGKDAKRRYEWLSSKAVSVGVNAASQAHGVHSRNINPSFRRQPMRFMHASVLNSGDITARHY